MRDTKSRLRVLLLLLLLALVAQGGYAEEEEKQLRKPKDKARKPFLEDDGLPDLDQKDERDFVMFLSKCCEYKPVLCSRSHCQNSDSELVGDIGLDYWIHLQIQASQNSSANR